MYAKLFAAAVGQGFGAKLLILGEGECPPSLEAQVRLLGLDDCVVMHGFVKDTVPFYQRLDLQLLSFTCEVFDNVIFEALASGTPVVSTNCHLGPHESLEDGKYGRLVPVGDVHALATAKAESLKSMHDRAALKARAQDFSIDKAVDQYGALVFTQQKKNSLESPGKS